MCKEIHIKAEGNSVVVSGGGKIKRFPFTSDKEKQAKFLEAASWAEQEIYQKDVDHG